MASEATTTWQPVLSYFATFTSPNIPPRNKNEMHIFLSRYYIDRSTVSAVSATRSKSTIPAWSSVTTKLRKSLAT